METNQELIYGKQPDICMYGYCELKRIRLTYGCVGHNIQERSNDSLTMEITQETLVKDANEGRGE